MFHTQLMRFFVFFFSPQRRIKPGHLHGKWKQLESIRLSELSQSQKDKYHVVLLGYMCITSCMYLWQEIRSETVWETERRGQERIEEQGNHLKIHQ